MLGLDDEYAEAGKPALGAHSALVEQEFGVTVPRLDERTDRFKDSVMLRSGTGRVLVEHGVVFLDALRKITSVREWRLSLR